MDKVTFSEFGLTLYLDDIVTLSDYPTTKWVVSYGCYTYKNVRSNGWYFSAIGTSQVLPITNKYLPGIKVVSSAHDDDDGCPERPYDPICPPGPCPPGPSPIPHHMKKEIAQSFITVQTLAERNKLNDDYKLLPQGKIVRVNNVRGQVKYYEWDLANETWLDADFGIDASKYVTHEQLTAEVAEQIEAADIPGKIVEAIDSDPETRGHIEDVAKEAVAEVDERLTQQMSNLSEHVDEIDDSIQGIAEDAQQAHSEASQALTTAQDALSRVESAEEKADEAAQKADAAKEAADSVVGIAQDAKSTAEDAKTSVDGMVEIVGEHTEQIELIKEAQTWESLG